MGLSFAKLTLGALALCLSALAQGSAASEPLDGDPAEAADAAETGSTIAQRLARWAIASGDNDAHPFIIIDKPNAEVSVFDADGELRGVAPALVGLTPGDDATPGVGDRELSDISPEERTTPAGRFVAAYGYAPGGKKVLWVDYGTAISLHPAPTANKKERRLQRLRSPTVADNRITFGCINVGAGFYKDVVRRLFWKGGGVVYILPDSKPLEEVFPTFSLQAGLSAGDGAKAGAP